MVCSFKKQPKVISVLFKLFTVCIKMCYTDVYSLLNIIMAKKNSNLIYKKINCVCLRNTYFIVIKFSHIIYYF